MFTLLLLSLLCQAQSDSGCQVDYRFTITDPADEMVAAELKLSDLSAMSAPIHLRFAEGFAFARLPEPRLQGEIEIVAGSDPAVQLKRVSAYHWTLDPANSDVVRLKWQVPLDHRDLPQVKGRDEYEYPYLRSDHGMLVMSTLALLPDEVNEQKIRVEFHLPTDWTLHAPWPRLQKGLWSFRPNSKRALQSDMVAVGGWKVHQQVVSGMNLVVAFSPEQEFLYDDVVAKVAPIVEAELKLFGSAPQKDYLFLFGEPQENGAGGSPKTQSMTLYVDPALPRDFAVNMLSHLIAHEFHHTWMQARCQPVDELRFVAEGFTDYFAYLVSWQLNDATDQEYLAILNEKLVETETSLQELLASDPKSATLAEAGGPAFFQGGAAYQATYSGGLMMALWLDLGLRQTSDSKLEDLLRAFYEDKRWQDGTRPTSRHFWQLVESMGGKKMAKQGQELASAKGFGDWQQAFLQWGVVTKRELQQAQLQIRANFDGNQITDIDPNATGARIGLQSGDELQKVNGVQVQTAAEIRAAFTKPVDGRLAVELRRKNKIVKLDQAIPQDVKYNFRDSVLQLLRDMPLDLAPPTKANGDLRIMQFNIWQEGTSVSGGFEKIADVIAASNADIVALSEVRNYNSKDLHERLLSALEKRGCTYFGEYAGGDVGLLSRWPIHHAEAVADQTQNDHGSIIAYHLTGPENQKLVVCTAHLDYLNYAIYLPRGYDGNTFNIIDPDGDGIPNPVVELEALHKMDAASQRDEALAGFLHYASKLPSSIPVLLAGDFNECSHLDWTAATEDMYSHNGVVIEWKNSRRLSKAGMSDAWRSLFPNPVTHPGATWPAPAWQRGSTSWAPLVDERDRIDFIYHNGKGMKPAAAWVVGPRSLWLKNQLTPSSSADPLALTDHPWPSDHKALMLDFSFK
jgi:predicted metalloprotease with PDZ domain/endonuclease/exonuclease/phosphatase family metal-dependent hydrolase